MNTNEFRAELVKIMPGYKWTVKTPSRFPTDTGPGYAHMTATGIQSAGFNRMSTLEVVRRVDKDQTVEYTASVAGYGTWGPWVECVKENTLARALRQLQERCEAMRSVYVACVNALEGARGKKGGAKE